ncbi:hypothetical protein F4604DRAFT_1674537 [Suillus subluteus]|nr:hypothetical protein F4604DRAFT_1674537 [Suillus subluteus]
MYSAAALPLEKGPRTSCGNNKAALPVTQLIRFHVAVALPYSPSNTLWCSRGENWWSQRFINSLTIPTYFNNSQRQAAKDAATITYGLNTKAIGHCLFVSAFMSSVVRMGIPGLWERVASAADNRTLKQLAVSELKTEEIDSERKVKLFKIGIDASAWMHSRAGKSPELRTLFFRLGTLLKLPLHVVFVFDGLKHLPEKGRMVRNSPHWLTCDFQRMLELFGFKWTEAPGEAKAELATMNAHGVIDAAMTEDSDILIFGAPCIIRSAKKDKDYLNVEVYTEDGLEHGASLARGDSTAKLDRRCCMQFLSLAPELFSERAKELVMELRSMLATDPYHFLGRRYKAVADSIPLEFPRCEVISKYVDPITSFSATRSSMLAAQDVLSCQPHLADIADFCRVQFGWDDDAIVERMYGGIWEGAYLLHLMQDIWHQTQLTSIFKAAWKKGSATPKAALADVQKCKDLGIETRLQANNTRANYAGHVRRGQQWLASYFKTPAISESERGDIASDNLLIPMPSSPASFDMHSDNDVHDDPAFKDAFDRIPNRCSHKALALFMSLKGFHENLSKTTVESIRSAFKKMWDLSITWIRVLRWHQAACPLEIALHMIEKMMSGAQPSDLHLDFETRKQLTQHLEQIALAASGWTLWTRTSLLDVTMLDGVLKSYLANETLTMSDRASYFEIFLSNRKGWQKKVDKGQWEVDLRSNHYKIYPRPEMLACDNFFWMLVWIKWLEFFHYGRTLHPNDFLFPVMGANSVVHPGQPISHDTVQKWINESTAGAGILGQRWTLAKVRWWGGWAEGEHRDTLVRYLLDELHAYETDYSDALAPISRGADVSLAGEHALARPASTEELRMVHASVAADVNCLRNDISSVNNSLRSLTNKLRVHLMLHLLEDKIATSHSTHVKVSSPSARITSRQLPTPGLVIPRVPVLCPNGTTNPKTKSWKDIVTHWLDWPREWCQGANRQFASKYHQRATITLEFINQYDSNEARFLAAYPEAELGHTQLLKAVNKARTARGERVSRTK